MADQWTWESAQGETVILTDWAAGNYVTPIGEGASSPSYDVIADEYAGVDGSTVQAIRVPARTMTLGLYVDAPSKPEFRAKARRLVHLLRPKAGIGTLTCSTEWGESRSLACYCTGGLEGDMALNVGGSGFSWRMVLRFYAPDPWWYGPEQPVNFGLGAPTSFFPFFPLRLSPSQVQGEFTVDLSGADVPSFPVWTITGPGTSLLLTNETTGRSIEVAASLSAGQTMVIDTRAGQQSVRRGDGTNLMPTVTSGPALWPLVESVNLVSAQLSGATSESRIEAVFAPRYAGV